MLMYLVTVVGGTWLLEQPGGSCLEFYPCFRDLLAAHWDVSGALAVLGLVSSYVIYCIQNHRLSDFRYKRSFLRGSPCSLVDGTLRCPDTQETLCLVQLRAHRGPLPGPPATAGLEPQAWTEAAQNRQERCS